MKKGLVFLFHFLLIFTGKVLSQVPLNDNCTGATFVYLDQTGNGCVSDSNLNATSDGAFNTCDAGATAPLPPGGHEVWFSYVVNGPVNTITVVPIGANPAEKVSVTVINGNCAGGGSTNVCNSALTNFDPATVAFTSSAGTQIWFYVTALVTDGEFLVCITSTNGFIAPGLGCNTAPRICNTYDFTSPGSAQPGTSPTPSCFNSPPVRPFWYKFTSGYSGPLEFTGFPTNVGGFRWALYDITSGCPGTEIACNSVYDPLLPFGLSSSVSNCTTNPYCPPVNITYGNTYALMIDDTSQNGSGFDFTWGYDMKMLPTANFDVDTLVACGSLTADFSDNSIYNPSTGFNFNYGDGSPPVSGSGATFNVPSHFYGPGTYLATLTLAEPGGCSHSFSRQIIVKPRPAAAITTADDTLCFDGSNPVSSALTANTTAAGITYSWWFPNSTGSVVNGPGQATGTWNQSGVFPVGVQIIIDGCASDTAKDTIVILDLPDASFILTDSGCTNADETVVYNGGAGAGAVYNWTYAPGTITGPGNQQFDIRWTNPGTYPISLTVEEGGCTGNTYTDSIRIFATPTVNFNPPPVICEESVYTLNPLSSGAPAGSTFLWDFGNALLLGGNPSNGTSAILQWNTSGPAYVTVQVVSPEGCISLLDSTPLTVNAKPEIDFTISPRQICRNDSSLFVYTGLMPVSGNNFTFEFGGANILNFGSTGIAGPFWLSWATPGTYPIYLVGNDQVCNSDTLRDTVIVGEVPVANAGSDRIACAGQPVSIGSAAVPGYTYSWQPQQFVNIGTSANPNAVVPVVGVNDSTVQFILTATLGFCNDTDTVEVTGKAVQQAFFLPPPPQCERGNSFGFSPYYGIVPGATQMWIINNDTINAPAINNYTFQNTGSQTITLETTTPGCPPSQHTETVIVKENPVVDFSVNINEGCEPLEVLFQDLSPVIGGASYLWNFGNGIVSFLNNPSHTYSFQGSYQPSLTITSSDTCSTTDTLPGLINVYPVPDALFTASPLVASSANPVFSFESLFANASCYFDFGDGTGDSACATTHIYRDTGTYVVTLFTFNPGGCADTTSIIVQVLPNYSLYLPSAFTPNRDNINDRFEVFAEGVDKFEIKIFNRRGQVVYQSDNVRESWNGQYLNDGEECPQDVYVYEAEIRDFNRKKYNLRGKITLIR